MLYSPARALLCTVVTTIGLVLASAAPAPTAVSTLSASPEVGFAIIRTAKVSVLEGPLKPRGSSSKKIDSNFLAFLVMHHQDYLLFDTGMGSQLAGQYQPQELEAIRGPVPAQADPTQHSVEQVRDLLRTQPAIVVVPAHDSTVQNRGLLPEQDQVVGHLTGGDGNDTVYGGGADTYCVDDESDLAVESQGIDTPTGVSGLGIPRTDQPVLQCVCQSGVCSRTTWANRPPMRKSKSTANQLQVGLLGLAATGIEYAPDLVTRWDRPCAVS